MKALLFALLVLIAATGLGLALFDEPGYLLIGYGEWTIETTLAMALFVLLLAFASLYLLLRFIAGLRRSPRALREWRRRRRAARARKALNRGLVDLSEGNWEAAEKRLIRYAGDSDNPLMNYLAAARAAQAQGAHERRDHYLRLAHQAMPEADIAVGLTQAELQIAHRQMEQALATLTHLRTLAPRHPHVLKMLMKLYQRLGDWEHLRDLLPELRKRQVIDGEAADALEHQIHTELLAQAARGGDVEALQQAWARVPRRLTRDPELVLAHARHLHQLDRDADAEPLLRQALRQQWDDRLVDLYGRLRAPQPGLQLEVAEEWLRQHPDNPVLLQALGRIALRNELWGKARSYLQNALELMPTVEGYALLAALLERLGEGKEAVALLRRGVALASGDDGPDALPPPASPAAPLPGPEAQPEAGKA